MKYTRKMFHQSITWVFKEEITAAFQEGADQETIQVLLWFLGAEDADISLWNDLSVDKQSSLTLRNWPLSSVVFSSGSVFSVELQYGTALKNAFWSGFLRNLVIHLYRAFSLTWPTSMQFFWNNRKPLHKKRVNYHWIGLEHQHSRRSLFWNTNGHRCENTLYGKEVTMFSKKSRSAIRHNSDPALRAYSKWTIADAKAAMLVDKKNSFFSLRTKVFVQANFANKNGIVLPNKHGRLVANQKKTNIPFWRIVINKRWLRDCYNEWMTLFFNRAHNHCHTVVSLLIINTIITKIPISLNTKY